MLPQWCRRNEGFPLALAKAHQPVFFDQAVEQDEAGVVPVETIFTAGVAQAHNEKTISHVCASESSLGLV